MIKFGKIRKGAKIPSYATSGSGWADMYACFDEYEMVIPAHECKQIGRASCRERV